MQDSSAYPDTFDTSGGNVFGSPKQRDFIGSVEKSINDVVDRTTRHFEETVDRVAPRALGSTKVPTEQARQDYLLSIATATDPVAAGEQWVRDKASQYGLAKALDMFADYVIDNERWLAEFGKERGLV